MNIKSGVIFHTAFYYVQLSPACRLLCIGIAAAEFCKLCIAAAGRVRMLHVVGVRGIDPATRREEQSDASEAKCYGPKKQLINQ